MKRLIRLFVVALAMALALVAAAGGARSKGRTTVNQQDAIAAAAVGHGLITETPNTATAPAATGAPAFLYSAVAPPPPLEGTSIIAAGVVEYVTARVAFDAPEAVIVLPEGTIVIGAQLLGGGFDGGADNKITFSTGSSIIPGGGPKITFAAAHNVDQPYSVVVGVNTVDGTDLPAFAAQGTGADTAVYVNYGYTGADPTQGATTVILTLIRPGVE